MTNLTDKWKKGELPEGDYWVKHDGVINILDELEISLTSVDEVLDKVPSYEEWQAKLEENKTLKKLLKKHRDIFARTLALRLNKNARCKMIKKYFVSYNFMNKDGLCGFGNCILKCDKEITVNTLTEWREVIEKNSGFKQVVILNFIEVQDD